MMGSNSPSFWCQNIPSLQFEFYNIISWIVCMIQGLRLYIYTYIFACVYFDF